MNNNNNNNNNDNNNNNNNYNNNKNNKNNNSNEAIKMNYNKLQKYFILLNFDFLKVKDVVQFCS